MLVLGRGREQSIMIGDDIEIKVVSVRGKRVRLGIKAPKKVKVHRKEVWEAIKKAIAKAGAGGAKKPANRGGRERHPNLSSSAAMQRIDSWCGTPPLCFAAGLPLIQKGFNDLTRFVFSAKGRVYAAP